MGKRSQGGQKKRYIDTEVPIDPPAPFRGFCRVYNFLKAHSKPCKIRHVSTLAAGVLTCGGLLKGTTTN